MRCERCGGAHRQLEGRALDCEQNRAVDLLLDWRWSHGVITGGPGTGKTTVVRAALDELDAQRRIYVLAAPTGKAARRMAEATGRPAITLHKLLRLKPRSNYIQPFGDHPRRKLASQYVFIDEASMIDVVLMAELQCALNSHTCLRLIGDADQLPPVGPGEPFADYVREQHYPMVRLKRVHRSGPGSWVAQNAPLVLAGKMPELCAPSLEHGFRFIESRTLADVPLRLQALLSETGKWSEIAAVAPVLTPQRTTAGGVHALNTLLSEHKLGVLDPQTEPFLELEEGAPLRQGARVMQTRNDSLREIVNGQVGVLEEMPNETDPNVWVSMDDRESLVRYTKLQAVAELQLAYAFTVHKTQGSEYPWVIVICHSAHRMVTRKLLYTAMTRAKEGVILIGDTAGIRNAVNNKNEQVRMSGLRDRLRARRAAHNGPRPWEADYALEAQPS